MISKAKGASTAVDRTGIAVRGRIEGFYSPRRGAHGWISTRVLGADADTLGEQDEERMGRYSGILNSRFVEYDLLIDIQMLCSSKLLRLCTVSIHIHPISRNTTRYTTVDHNR